MSVGRVLVYGGKGALGAACVSKFKAQKWVSEINILFRFNFKIKYFCSKYQFLNRYLRRTKVSSYYKSYKFYL